MTLAVNDAGDVLTDASGAWKPATVAQHEGSGARLALDGGSWKPLPDQKPPMIDTTATEFGQPYAVPSSAGPQSQFGADVNALGQGVVQGAGAVVAGAGRLAQSAGTRAITTQLKAMDAIDRGERVGPDQDIIGYQDMSSDQRERVRANMEFADSKKYDPSTAIQTGEPNVGIRAGEAIQKAAPGMFPVALEKEGFQTGVARVVGGAAPAVAGGLMGGPAGLLASAAAIGSQAYDGTYQDAITKGASHEDADNAAGRSAMTQVLTMALPLNRLVTVPVSLREGLAKTLVNLGQHGVEMGTASAIGTLANNYVAQQTYDPERPLLQGTGQTGLEGAVAGLIIRGAATGLRDAGPMPRSPEAIAADVMKATDLDSAIAAARQAARVNPDFDSLRGGSPENPEIGAARIEGPKEATAFDWASLFSGPRAGNPTPVESGSFGAAVTPGELTNMSTKDMKANRYQAEMGELLGPPQANDTTIYVKGSYPTLAERSGNPEISQQENLLRQRNPSAFIGDGKRLTENNRARVAAFDDQTPSRTAIDMMKDNRDARWQADSQSILPNAKPADLTPALDWVQGQLGDPRVREVDAVRSILENFHDRLIDEDGNPKSDPAAIWGIHDNIQNQLSKAKDPLNATGAEKYAFSELMAAKKIVDGVMNKATDNQFQTALDNYAQASQEINAGEALEKFRPRLTNASGDVQAANFHRFVIGLADLRGRAGIDPAMSISDDAMRTLINIDNDLKRAGLIRMGAAAGSPTNLLGALAERMGMGAVHMAGGGFMTRAVAKVGMDLVAQHRLEAMTNKHLAPPEGGYTELTP